MTLKQLLEGLFYEYTFSEKHRLANECNFTKLKLRTQEKRISYSAKELCPAIRSCFRILHLITYRFSKEKSLFPAFKISASTWWLYISAVQFSSVAQSCPTLCSPMNCSTPGLPVHQQLPEFTQTHVHRVSDAIQPSHPLSSPSPPAPKPSQHQSLFQWVNSSHEVAKVADTKTFL